MCISKLDPKTLDKIVNEAVKIESGITYAEIARYEKRIREKHYEPIAYGQLELDKT